MRYDELEVSQTPTGRRFLRRFFAICYSPNAEIPMKNDELVPGTTGRQRKDPSWETTITEETAAIISLHD